MCVSSKTVHQNNGRTIALKLKVMKLYTISGYKLTGWVYCRVVHIFFKKRLTPEDANLTLTNEKTYFFIGGIVAFNSTEYNRPIEGEPTNSRCVVLNKLLTPALIPSISLIRKPPLTSMV